MILALPWPQEEHGADRHPIRVEQPVDGQAQAASHDTGARARGVIPTKSGNCFPPGGAWTAFGRLAGAGFISRMGVAHFQVILADLP